jgi:hypothetical protein
MSYSVRFVSDDLMPEGHDWVLCDQSSDGAVLCIRASARQRADDGMAKLLEEAWAGYRAHVGLTAAERAAG